jgi:hypothetical protein
MIQQTYEYEEVRQYVKALTLGEGLSIFEAGHQTKYDSPLVFRLIGKSPEVILDAQYRLGIRLDESHIVIQKSKWIPEVAEGYSSL